jgi:hypothetical protein
LPRSTDASVNLIGFFLAASSGDITKLCGGDGVVAVELEAPELCASLFFSCAKKVPPTMQNINTAHNAFSFSDIAHPAVAQVSGRGRQVGDVKSPLPRRFI